MKPWTIKHYLGGAFEVSEDGDPVLRIRGGMTPTLKHARLIAAAPEMLAALETIKRLAESGSMSLGTLIRCGEEASAAIAKAKGAQ